MATFKARVGQAKNIKMGKLAAPLFENDS